MEKDHKFFVKVGETTDFIHFLYALGYKGNDFYQQVNFFLPLPYFYHCSFWRPLTHHLAQIWKKPYSSPSTNSKSTPQVVSGGSPLIKRCWRTQNISVNIIGKKWHRMKSYKVSFILTSTFQSIFFYRFTTCNKGQTGESCFLLATLKFWNIYREINPPEKSNAVLNWPNYKFWMKFKNHQGKKNPTNLTF